MQQQKMLPGFAPRIVLTKLMPTQEPVYMCTSASTKPAYGVTAKAAFLKWKWKNRLGNKL